MVKGGFEYHKNLSDNNNQQWFAAECVTEAELSTRYTQEYLFQTLS